MSIHTIIDEPNRHIEMSECVVPQMVAGLRFNEYVYQARRNGGPWLDLKPLGNRIPSDW